MRMSPCMLCSAAQGVVPVSTRTGKLPRLRVGGNVLKDVGCRNEVEPIVVGRQGTLYQKCSSWQDATSRLAQALFVGGIVAHVIDDAWRGVDFDALWLSALAPSPIPRFHVSPHLLVMPPLGIPPSAPLNNATTLMWEPVQWSLFDAGKRAPAEEQTPPLRPLAPRPSRTPQPSTERLPPSLSQRPQRSPSPYPFAQSLQGRHTPSLSAVGGAAFGVQQGQHSVSSTPRVLQSPGIPELYHISSPTGLPTSRIPSPPCIPLSPPRIPLLPPCIPPSPSCPTHPVERSGFYTVYCGCAPWLYYSQ